MLRRIVVFICICYFANLQGASTHYLMVNGYLGHSLVQELQEEVLQAQQTQGGELIVHINSSSGNLQQALYLTHQIYDLKNKQHKHVKMYIQGKAVGPAAILPFIADELMTTPLVAWGDIFYGTAKEVKEPVIQECVRKLIQDQQAKAAILNRLCHAMLDPHCRIIYEGNHAVIEEEVVKNFDPLILNLKGLQSLGLVDRVVTNEEFKQQFIVSQNTGKIEYRD